MLFCLAALIFRPRQNFSPRGLVFPDRLNTLDRRPRPKSLRRAGRSCRFWIWVSSAAGGAHRFLCIVSMQKFVFDTMHGKLDWFLENQRNRFCGSTPHSNCQVLILGKLAEATKILIISNDQKCHLCNVRSIVYSISCTPEATDLNQGCALCHQIW